MILLKKIKKNKYNLGVHFFNEKCVIYILCYYNKILKNIKIYLDNYFNIFLIYQSINNLGMLQILSIKHMVNIIIYYLYFYIE